MRASSRRPSTLAIFIAILSSACGGGGDPPTTEPPGGNGGSFSLSPSVVTTSLAAGASQTVTITVTRSGSFTGAVTLSAGSLPTGVTASFNPAQVPSGATTSLLTLTAAASATAGTAAVTITGSGSGVSSATAGVSVTVTAPATNALFTITPSVTGFQLGATNSTVNFHQPTITITRNAGYTGAITFSVSGLPLQVVAGVTPTTATGNSATMLFINGGVANGTYTGTIRAVGANGGGERTLPITIVAAPPTTGSVVWSHCSFDQKLPAYFVAVRDGSGPWTRVVADNDGYRYSFNVSSPTASIAYVSADSGVARTTVFNYTRQELVQLGITQCALQPPSSTRTVTGSVTGLAAGQLSMQSMGFWSVSSVGTGASYTLLNLPTGSLDLVGFRNSLDSDNNLLPNAVILRRNFDPAPGATIAPLDYNSAEATGMLSSRWTVGGTNGEAFSVSQYFNTVGGTSAPYYPLPQLELSSTSRTVMGLAVARTLPGDLHQTILTIGSLAPRRASRQVIAYQRTISDRAIDFGPVLPTPTVTSVSANGAGMIRAVGTLPAEYQAGVTMDVKSTGSVPRFATVHTSRGFLGTTGTYDVRMPDLSGVFGWDTNWNIRPGDAAEWWVSGGGAILDFFDGRNLLTTTRKRWAGILTGIEIPGEGSTYKFARASGTITP